MHALWGNTLTASELLSFDSGPHFPENATKFVGVPITWTHSLMLEAWNQNFGMHDTCTTHSRYNP